jgi:hypothetical protein
MKEFMFFIRKQGNSQETLPPDMHHKFLKSCERYIGNLKKEGKLITAQPIEWKGSIVSRADTTWRETPFNEGVEVIGGYYHILAKDLHEATIIAKANPEFEYNPNTRIEIRPIKMKEESTGFLYPGA